MDSQLRIFKFENFTTSELVNPRLVRYPAGNLNAPIDTVDLLQRFANNDWTTLGPLPYNHDYRVLLNNNQFIYTVSNIVTRNEDCNCTRGTYKVMTSYQVNGQVRNSDDSFTIVIVK